MATGRVSTWVKAALRPDTHFFTPTGPLIFLQPIAGGLRAEFPPLVAAA
jgi:hypothetical protein